MPVRVVDMRGVDLARYAFDWDLTFAALAMHPDGTIYHRYGGRDHRGPDTWLSTPSFADFLEAGLAAHASYAENPSAPRPLPRLVIEEVAAYARKDDGKCIHCHVIHPALRADAIEKGAWRDEQLWVYPPPERVGFDLARDDQTLVTGVLPDSAATRAGLSVGDRVLSLGSSRIATASDVSAALHGVSAGGAKPVLAVEREGERRELPLTLDEGWKEGTPLSFSWRSFKWDLTPQPGFGGPLLSVAEKRELGLEPDVFAFRVGYLVTWNENRRFGRAAQRAGLRKGMLVLGTTAKRDFASMHHFHAWWRFTRKVGEKVGIVLWEDSKERVLELEVVGD